MQLKQLLSYIWDIPIEKTSSEFNPYLEVVWSYGRKMLNTKNANYSFGNGFKVFERAMKVIVPELTSANNMLILGFGCGSILHLLEKKYRLLPSIQGVEYDEVVLDLFQRHFADNYELKPELYTSDAQAYVESCNERFDVVFIDLFEELNNAPVMAESKFIDGLCKIGFGGTLVFNLTEQNIADKELIQELTIRLSNSFSDIQRTTFQEYNQILIAKATK